MAKRLIFGENATNAWYEPKDADNKYKTLQLVPNSEALTSSGYDASKADSAYKAAKYYVNILNAKSYHTILGENSGVDVVYSYSNDIEASVESLIKAGDWHLSPAFNMTMIACLVCLAFAAVFLGLYYRLGAVAILSNVAVSDRLDLALIRLFPRPVRHRRPLWPPLGRSSRRASAASTISPKSKRNSMPDAAEESPPRGD
jgi:hypothetical protein